MYTISRDHIRWSGGRDTAVIYGGLRIMLGKSYRRESKLGSGGESEDQASWIPQGDHSEVGLPTTLYFE
jgi:hypothetical protein